MGFYTGCLPCSSTAQDFHCKNQQKMYSSWYGTAGLHFTAAQLDFKRFYVHTSLSHYNRFIIKKLPPFTFTTFFWMTPVIRP